MEKPPLAVNRDWKLRAQPLAAALEGAVRDHRKTPKHKIQTMIAAVYPCTIWRQGFAAFLFDLIISHSYQTDKNI